MHLRTHDQVVIRSGKDRGKTGKIVRVLPKAGKVVVAGLNMVKKHAKPTPKVPQGGIISFESPLSASNVMLLCTVCSKATRVGRKITKDGTIRICKRCGAAITVTK